MKKHCQSCGMPLDQDPRKWGTENDGTHSTLYCSYCYDAGSFKNPDWTIEQMMQYVAELTEKMWLPSAHRKIAIAAVPKLERWKEN